MESIMMLFVAVLYVTALVIGWSRYIYIDFLLVIKHLSNPYYHIGISFIEHETEDPEFIEQELILGIFFIEFVIVFYKQNIEA
jgi:hypothetical protein